MVGLIDDDNDDRLELSSISVCAYLHYMSIKINVNTHRAQVIVRFLFVLDPDCTSLDVHSSTIIVRTTVYSHKILKFKKKHQIYFV